ncbi:MAG: DoxX family protein [Burkholderiaceae bacterium]|nr:DoxX family protein [Burkholderiaceae bacterium]
MEALTKNAYPIGRALIGVLFLVSGINKILAFSYVAGWMASMGLPLASVLLVLTIAVEIGGGLMLITGVQARFAALLLALFLIPVTFVFHAFWSADAATFQNQLVHFLKNLSIFGAMLVVFDSQRKRAVAK